MKRIEKIIRWALLVLMCVVIFIFSGFKAVESTDQSNFIIDTVVKVFFYDFNDYPQPQQDALISMLNVVVRKGAHFSEYALLAVLAFGAFYGISRYFPRWLAAVLFSFVYACSDEFHQIFVPGRAGMIRDVLLDTSGACTGALLACLVSVYITALKIMGKERKRTEKISNIQA